MKKIVKYCGNCPFLYNETDLLNNHICLLSKNLNLNTYHIDKYENIFDKNNTPIWCPLKNEEYIFEFENISNNKLDEIHDDVENEIAKSINEIKNQMSYIEETSAKLQDAFNKISEQ